MAKCWIDNLAIWSHCCWAGFALSGSKSNRATLSFFFQKVLNSHFLKRKVFFQSFWQVIKSSFRLPNIDLIVTSESQIIWLKSCHQICEKFALSLAIFERFIYCLLLLLGILYEQIIIVACWYFFTVKDDQVLKK